MAGKNKKKKQKQHFFERGPKQNQKKKKKQSAAEETVSSLSEEETMLRENAELYVEVPHSDDFTEEDFSKSVESFSDKDVKDVEKTETRMKKKKKKRMSPLENAIQIGLIVVCAAVAVYCAVLLVKNVYGKIRGNEIYSNTEFQRFTPEDGIEDSFNHPVSLKMLTSDTPMLTLYERIIEGKSVDNSSKNQNDDKMSLMKSSLSALRSQYPNVYGWIYVPDTNIDYPIMRGEDNDYYLDHAYTGESLPIGSIFCDYHTLDTITDNFNTVIYGHNVVTGAMFHDMTKFLDAAFMENDAHRIYVYTMDGVYVYKVVSVYPTNESYFYYRTNFLNEADFLSFANEVAGNSQVPTGERFASGDTMITLSTCTNGTDVTSGRYALHAKLVEIIK